MNLSQNVKNSKLKKWKFKLATDYNYKNGVWIEQKTIVNYCMNKNIWYFSQFETKNPKSWVKNRLVTGMKRVLIFEVVNIMVVRANLALKAFSVLFFSQKESGKEKDTQLNLLWPTSRKWKKNEWNETKKNFTPNTGIEGLIFHAIDKLYKVHFILQNRNLWSESPKQSNSVSNPAVLFPKILEPEEFFCKKS